MKLLLWLMQPLCTKPVKANGALKSQHSIPFWSPVPTNNFVKSSWNTKTLPATTSKRQSNANSADPLKLDSWLSVSGCEFSQRHFVRSASHFPLVSFLQSNAANRRWTSLPNVCTIPWPVWAQMIRLWFVSLSADQKLIWVTSRKPSRTNTERAWSRGSRYVKPKCFFIFVSQTFSSDLFLHTHKHFSLYTHTHDTHNTLLINNSKWRSTQNLNSFSILTIRIEYKMPNFILNTHAHSHIHTRVTVHTILNKPANWLTK